MTSDPLPANDDTTIDPIPGHDAVAPNQVPATQDATTPDRDVVRSRWRRFCFVLGSIGFGIVIATVLSEIALRVLGIVPAFSVIYRENFRLSDNKVLNYELVPGSKDRGGVINSAGFRDREFPVAKPDGVFRIVVIGDSVVFGYGCPQQNAFEKHLERMLNQYAPSGSVKFEVLNFGVPGYNATQIAESLRSHAMRYDPDLVIYGYVLNDGQDFSIEQEALALMKEEANNNLKQILSHRINRMLSHSRLFLMLLQAGFDPPKSPNLFAADPQFTAMRNHDVAGYVRALHENPATFARVTEALDAIAVITAPRSIPVLVAVFPIRRPSPWNEYPLEDIHAMVMKEARRRHFYAMDLAPSMRLAQNALRVPLFLDFVHPTTWGHHAVAVALLKWLCASPLLPGDGISFDRVLADRGEDGRVARYITPEVGDSNKP